VTVLDTCLIGPPGNEKAYFVIKDTNMWPYPKRKDWPDARKNCICFIDFGKLSSEQSAFWTKKQEYGDDVQGMIKAHLPDFYFIATTIGVQFTMYNR